MGTWAPATHRYPTPPTLCRMCAALVVAGAGATATVLHSPHVGRLGETWIFKVAGELGAWTWELGAGSWELGAWAWELGAVSNDTVSAAGTSIWRLLQGKLSAYTFWDCKPQWHG